MNEHEIRIPFIEEYSRAKKNYRGSKISSKKKASGIYKLYLHYCYLLKVFPKRYPSKYVPPSIRADVKKMERISNEARLLSSNNIKNTEQLFLYMDNLSEELSNLKAKREDCYIKLKKSDATTKELIQNKITNLTEKINIIKAERGMCREICERIPIMKDNVKEMYAKENNKGRKKEHERTK